MAAVWDNCAFYIISAACSALGPAFLPWQPFTRTRKRPLRYPVPMSHPPDPNANPPGVFSPSGTCSPHPRLLTHYLILCLFTGPGFLIAFPVAFFRYHTLRYRFDADGVSMNVGILFRREVVLTYRRIQDIHVTRGIIQRWLGLATVACQTASGSSGPELVIEGLLDYEQVRDFLYQQMRGAKEGHAAIAATPDATPLAAGSSQSPDEALALLTDIRDRIATLTREVESLRAASRKEPPHG
jgi:uncharacterized protein